MNKMIWMAAATLMFASCNNTASTEEKTVAESPQRIEIPISELASPKDLVCGMDVTVETLEDTTTYDGKVYAFCNTGCKEEFLKNPTSYLTSK